MCLGCTAATVIQPITRIMRIIPPILAATRGDIPAVTAGAEGTVAVVMAAAAVVAIEL